MARAAVLSCALLAAISAFAPARSTAEPTRPYPKTETREPCASFAPHRQPFFGDTHVHTTFSQDASTQDTRVTPHDAYRFAKGEPLAIQPFDADEPDGRSLRTVAIDRPLDFTVVTDHSEQLGETHICKTRGLPGHDAFICRIYRSWPRAAFYLMNARTSALDIGRWGFCGEDDEHCLAAARTIWGETRDAAEAAYDRSSACSFTSFVGYEWTAGGTGHLHRNVVFRNEFVPELPVSKYETGNGAIELWRQLDATCRDGVPGCEAITIPHNSNIGNGMTFTSTVEVGGPIGSDEAPIRQRYDVLAEVMQHKGDSECANYPGVSDEACGFEKLAGMRSGAAGSEVLDPIDYVRDALKRGIAFEAELGTNPLKYGMIASTDTHLGTPGLVKERGHPGHGGGGKHARDGIPVGFQDDLWLNPGGLAVLWAEENTRDALFAAMRRREAYGTSGTRPVVRFFGGWNYDANVCDAPDVAAEGYAGGVPMGGDLPANANESAAPRFVVSALRDPGADAAPLERIEIIKGWVEAGERKERVVLAAGGPNGSDVDLASCERRGAGADRLCAVWQDDDFDSAEPAFYYARVLENPSCRWSQWACVDAGVVCGDPATMKEGFEECCSGDHRKTIQERAWTSPVWYRPAAD